MRGDIVRVLLDGIPRTSLEIAKELGMDPQRCKQRDSSGLGEGCRASYQGSVSGEKRG